MVKFKNKPYLELLSYCRSYVFSQMLFLLVVTYNAAKNTEIKMHIVCYEMKHINERKVLLVR